MTVYPFALDSDEDLIRVDDNITEIGGEAINQLRDAMFAVESELGIQPAGSAGSVANRLSQSLNPDGSIKASALTSIGLVTLPIADGQVASNAGIKEYKLDLDYATSDLHTLILSNTALISSLTSFSNEIFSDLNAHIAGATLLSDGGKARHVASHIDLNAVPSDARDAAYSWSGLEDKDGQLRSATHVAEALLQINDDLVAHQNAITDAHVATAVTVDTDDFEEIPQTADTVQKVLDYLDDAELLNLGQHRATQHANGIPRITRSQSPSLPDGYRENVVPSTPATAYLVHSPNTSPVDDLSVGDDIIKFVPSNSGFVFDAQFSRVRAGDVLRINYGNGVEASYPIESIRYIPGTEWLVRINGVNLYDTSDGYALARIDRASYDVDTSGILALASANARNSSEPIYTNILSSVIVGHPRAASALGLGFDSNQLNSDHYKLYLELYPTGNPSDKVIGLPAIDVTGNAGTTPGKYTLDSVVQATNDKFREIGYNYRFIAFAHRGEFGLMLADCIGNASFAIVRGSNASGTLITSTYTENVIGGDSLDNFDALGLGPNGADVASPAYQSTWLDETAAQLPTKVIVPLKQRYYIVNGRKRDDFATTYMANEGGYWDGYISARTPVGITNVEVTYTVLLDLKASELRPGKTIVVQPDIDFDDPDYNDVDYGRFIIKSVNFVEPCGSTGPSTEITVINGLHAFGSGFGFSSSPQLPVRLYFSEDSVAFNSQNLIDDGVSSADYSRFHEIFINDSGKTFSHERARLPRQNETTSLLNTTNWHVRKVSSKLRGYRDSDPLVFNKYVRFYILSYNSTSGEFDGYLGQKVGSSTNITKTGPIITGRKNVPARFYDETGLDYIDLVFEDNDPSPGLNALSTAVPRYVDIELFPSLQTDDELMLLGTCEVNWDPTSGTDIIQQVQDAREFGSVDETDFTNSAIDFISAADKYLHQNGVIRGLDYDSTGSSGEVFFKGGIAIVNGKVVSVNNSSVTIPQIYLNGSSLPSSVFWIVCVNENGNLIPILFTPTKLQTFMTTGSGSYYVPSVTLDELVVSRKDLTPIAYITATIASITISSVADIRKFVATEDAAAPLVWSADNEVVGNFYSFSALKTWLQIAQKEDTSRSSLYNLVKVRGTFTLAAGEDPYDLTGLIVPVIFDGEESYFNIEADTGFLLGSNVTLRNFTFNYSGAGTAASATSLINGGDACLYAEAGTAVSRLKIEDCKFIYSSPAQRPPFILVELEKGQVNKDIQVVNNIFEESSPASYLAEAQAAIVFITNNGGVGSGPATLIDVEISGNKCNNKQGIYVTTEAGATGAETPGLTAYNVFISRNSCGIIGALTSSASNTESEIQVADRVAGMTIERNNCNYIGNLYDTGELQVEAGDLFYATGQLQILNNRANWLALFVKDISASNEYSSTIVKGNQFTGFDTDFLAVIQPTIPNAAILVYESSNSDSSEVIIEGNTIQTGYQDGTAWTYANGIRATCSANILNNSIRGLASAGYGIYIGSDGGSSTKRYQIKGNKIYRGGVSLTAYINIPNSATSEGAVVLNYFDSHTIDGASNTATITNYPNNWIITNNKNQTITRTLVCSSGDKAIQGHFIPAPSSSLSSVISLDNSVTPTLTYIRFNYQDTAATVRFRWIVSLNDVIPSNVYLTQLDFTYNASVAAGTLTYSHVDSAGNSVSSPIAIATIVDESVSASLTSAGRIKEGVGSPYLMFLYEVNNAATITLDLKTIQLTYRY